MSQKNLDEDSKRMNNYRKKEIAERQKRIDETKEDIENLEIMKNSASSFVNDLKHPTTGERVFKQPKRTRQITKEFEQANRDNVTQTSQKNNMVEEIETALNNSVPQSAEELSKIDETTTIKNVQDLLNSDKAIILILMKRLSDQRTKGDNLQGEINLYNELKDKLKSLKTDIEDADKGIGQLLASGDYENYKVLPDGDFKANVYLETLIGKYKLIVEKLIESIKENKTSQDLSNELSGKLRTLTTEGEQLLLEQQQANTAKEKAEAEARGLREKNEVLNADLERLNTDLTDQINQSEKTVGELEESLKKLRDELDSSSGNTDLQKDIILQMQQQMSLLKQKITELDEKILELNAKLEDLQNQLRDCKNSKNDILIKINQLNSNHLKMIMMKAKKENITFTIEEIKEVLDSDEIGEIDNTNRLTELLKNGFSQEQLGNDEVVTRQRLDEVIQTYFKIDNVEEKEEEEETSGGKRKTKKKKKSRKKRTLRKKNKSLKKKKRKTSKK